jgi:MraZ protein
MPHFLSKINKNKTLINFLGEYDCRLDEKCRIRMPSALIRQIPVESQNLFVINRGFEAHLILHPKTEWLIITEKINKLNIYDRKVRNFMRFFFRGATELVLDNSGRLMLPKSLLEWGKIEKDVILFAYGNQIEIWNKDTYGTILSNEPDAFAELAEQVMGTKKQDDSGN